ncbi:CPBP family intramembrane glutamic endopeptidase [Cyclobacterium sp. SYSU L10401]|uniref:CPBP family intramembrane glutamic endopeptidase n=1 Tax=Cyclobacterium sp. SYSU L10401 TaxID=2678657 RepID=UPI0013D753D9|nr:CPBP family intramembrane glutamic endopeptidase [Cyclobacterium sp. SYSU L10401]
MLEILSILSLILIFIFSIRAFYIFYNNKVELREIAGIYFLESLTYNLYFFILIFILFYFIILLNIYNGYIVLNFTNNYKIIFSHIPKYLSIAIVEEFIFRILLFASLIHYISNKNALIFFTSVLFSLYHFPTNGVYFVSYFLAGIMYGYSFVKFQFILIPTGIHFSWNFIQGAIFGFPVSGIQSEGFLNISIIPDEIYNGGSQGPEGSLFGIMIRLAIILLIYFLPSKQTINF